MAVPSTNVKFSDIWSEANGTYSTGILSLNTMSFFSYFTGLNGSGNQPDNNWGQGEGSGANRIYLTTAKTTNIKVSDFSGLNYFYDSNYDRLITVNGAYSGPSPIMPPDPPDCYDFNIRLTLYDSSLTYIYAAGGFSLAPFFPTFGADIQQDTITPLINTYYWVLDIQTSPSYPGLAGAVTANFFINGSPFFTSATVNNGGNTYDSTTYGTATIALNSPLANKTGSLWDVTMS